MTQEDLASLYTEWKQTDQVLRFGQYVYNLTGVESELSYQLTDSVFCYKILSAYIASDSFVEPRIPDWS